MAVLVWLVVGLIAGFLARLVLPGEEPGPGGILGDLIVGVIGGLIGGWTFRSFGAAGVTGINIGSIIVAFIGAVILLVIWRAIAGTRVGRRPV
ncbi:MAG: GlsB/YeaQ/YmgE family stress response membrane protein [Armatimonadota bacterium]|nr:GlsB/YeaQ/YmgE family stress response membrane protein [Armatimonadota bacterium]